jgi:hypothetical protein
MSELKGDPPTFCLWYVSTNGDLNRLYTMQKKAKKTHHLLALMSVRIKKDPNYFWGVEDDDEVQREVQMRPQTRSGQLSSTINVGTHSNQS